MSKSHSCSEMYDDDKNFITTGKNFTIISYNDIVSW